MVEVIPGGLGIQIHSQHALCIDHCPQADGSINGRPRRAKEEEGKLGKERWSTPKQPGLNKSVGKSLLIHFRGLTAASPRSLYQCYSELAGVVRDLSLVCRALGRQLRYSGRTLMSRRERMYLPTCSPCHPPKDLRSPDDPFACNPPPI